MSADRKPGRIALTGAPGWLANAFLDTVAMTPDIQSVHALVHPAAWTDNPISIHPAVSTVTAHDLGDRRALDVTPAFEGIDTVIHAAGIIHVRRTEEWYRINTEGTLRLAAAARNAGVKRFIFISSNAAGGRSRSSAHILTEEDPARPLSHYGRSKWLAEQGLMRLHQAGSFEVVILRPSMFYGPPVPQRHIDVYRRIRNGRFPVVGTGKYSRSITYIDHLVQAVQLAATKPQATGQTYYVVDEHQHTTLDICEAMAEALGTRLRKLWLPSVAGPLAFSLDRVLAAGGMYWQTLHLVGESHWHVGLSCEKLCRELGYCPSVNLREGMRRAVAWCREHGYL
jgi:nucleoside-diphosphate-sugar epimerase